MSAAPVIGHPVPTFDAPSTAGDRFHAETLHGQRALVLYFYPRDSTPGCTREAEDFRDRHPAFLAAGAEILGVSRDSLASHERFRAKLELPFHLLSDGDSTLCTLFDVIKTKNMYGRQVLGIERSTFLIDREGVLRAEWRKVKVPGHADAVFEALKQL
ncbi:peroxiredoxin [Acidihalobacter prosperus]|uniref:thioredoxin-dependent peroxiredoxin n=1 Tax=Acidihalobacter prosperus TaxID=160660 RepID=A0A1A6C5T2_9GAMM|nr:peroxiredoxin [Acidihalobacter prosperus]OBS09922.1 peroxiredoxin [Acidihalobacter prosperus]